MNGIGDYALIGACHSAALVGRDGSIDPHMALVLSCAHLSAAKKGVVPLDGAHDYAGLALDRLLASRSQGAATEVGH